MNNEPFFSIVVPTYNRAHFIKKTLLSVLDQKYFDFEVIVIDDGSHDHTAEVVNSIQDERLYYFYQENKERGAARNQGVRKAKGKYITFLDSDDLVYPDYLSEAYTYITNHKYPVFLHTEYEMVDDKGVVVDSINKRKGNLNQQLIYGNSLSCLGIFIQKKILLTYPFNEVRELSGSEDYELWMRLACIYSFSYSRKITSALVCHDERSVLGFDNDKLIKRVMLLIDYVTVDKGFQDKFGSQQNTFIAHRYLYLSLHLIMGKQNLLGIKYWIRALLHDPRILFHIKTLGIFKNILINLNNFFKSLYS